jgi:hypothetical protein
MNDRQMTPPNWPHLLACCAFAVPAGVAVVEILNYSVSVIFFDFPPTGARLGFLVHVVVFFLSVPALIIMAWRWKDFARISPVRQWLVMWGCWVVDFLAFAICMMET